MSNIVSNASFRYKRKAIFLVFLFFLFLMLLFFKNCSGVEVSQNE